MGSVVDMREVYTGYATVDDQMRESVTDCKRKTKANDMHWVSRRPTAREECDSITEGSPDT